MNLGLPSSWPFYALALVQVAIGLVGEAVRKSKIPSLWPIFKHLWSFVSQQLCIQIWLDPMQSLVLGEDQNQKVTLEAWKWYQLQAVCQGITKEIELDLTLG